MVEPTASPKIFLGWSKARSKEVGMALHRWLKRVIQAADPWISEHDLEAGTRWSEELAAQLEECHFGIVCMTPENLDSVWIHFEAGAIAKVLDQGRVVPYLLDVDDKQVTGPLTAFQMQPADMDGTRKVVEAVNNSLKSKKVEKEALAETFEMMWPKLESELARIRKMPGGSAPARRSEDMILEILTDVRAMRREIAPDALDRLIESRIEARRKKEWEASQAMVGHWVTDMPPDWISVTGGKTLNLSGVQAKASVGPVAVKKKPKS